MVTTEPMITLTPLTSADPQWDRLSAEITPRLPNHISREELVAHLSFMPGHYWNHAEEGEIIWHLEAIHDFFKLVSAEDGDPSKPIVRLRHFPLRGFSEIIVCTWNRQGLFAKITGALAAAGANITEAHAYTRQDNVVMDYFKVVSKIGGGAVNDIIVEGVITYLRDCLSPLNPLDLRQVIKISHAKPEVPLEKEEPIVLWDAYSGDEYTQLHVETYDYMGLLYEVSLELADADLKIHMANVCTKNNWAMDDFLITDMFNRKVTDADRLNEVKNRLMRRLGIFE